ncbi:ABC transporter substrate-binding protein [Herbidospora cretacea]|uniref:ABC transporter substrate-binding protein n=1 Tax=Herbidospora cretacea TaxID=28444 RepID=UPI000773659C|nr:ABC transporter substrate-binding protein [Herbidospora cretacea]
MLSIKRLGVAALAMASLTALAACGGGASGDEGDATTLSVGVPGIPPVFVNLMAYVAEQKGYFKDGGVTVTLRPLPTGADVGRAIQSKELDGGIVGTSGAVALRASGGNVVAILGNENPSFLIASSDPAVTDCASLKGRTIAVDGAGAPKALSVNTMIASCGLTAADITTVNVGGPQSVDALIAGQVDTAVLHPDELAAVNQKAKAHEVVALAKVDPVSHYTMLVTREDELADGGKRPAWVKAVAALHKSIAYINDPANADDVAQIAATMTKRTPEISKTALAEFVGIKFWPADAGLARERVDKAVADQVKAGNVAADKAPEYDDFVDLTVFDEALGK